MTTTATLARVCTCEHAAHFDAELATPRGRVNVHRYGLCVPDVADVVTTLGTFQLCATCADDCMRRAAVPA